MKTKSCHFTKTVFFSCFQAIEKSNGKLKHNFHFETLKLKVYLYHLVPVVLSVILDVILVVLPVILDVFLMFSIFSDVITVVSFVFHMIQSDFMPTII